MGLLADLRYAVRTLLKSPAFTFVTLLSLALGIGANTAIFQLLDAVHLRTLPVRDPDGLAEVKIQDKGFRSGNFSNWHAEITYTQWVKIRERQQGFSSLLAYAETLFNISPTGEVKNVRGALVSGGYFDTLGVAPFLGRVFTDADDRRGCGAPGVVVSHPFWQRQLGGDPGAVGRKLSIDGHEVEILGVTPPGFYGLEVGRGDDVIAPLCMEDTLRGDKSRLDLRHAYFLTVVGRLAPGWTRERAGAQLAAISRALFEDTVPQKYSGEMIAKYKQYELVVAPAAQGISELREEYSKPLYFLLATAALVLLIACANLANLLLARASAREREIAVRLAVGASRGRLVRQLMTESLLLAALGAAAGLFLASALSEALVRFLSTRDSERFVDLAFDWRVFAFTTAVAVLTCLLFGLAPALRASRTDVGVVLKAAGGRGTTVSRYGLRRMLVAVQVALSFVLLASALMFTRSLTKLSSVSMGFDERGVLVVSADLRALGLTAERIREVQARLVREVREAPGVVAASSTSIVPISGSAWNHRVFVDGGDRAPAERVNTWFARVSPGYFATMGTAILAGRDFGPGDDVGAPVVGIINQTAAKKFFGDENPVGRRLRVGASSNGQEWTIDVVGVVADTKYRELREEYRPIIRVPQSQEKDPYPGIDLVIRGQGPLAGTVESVKKAAAAVSPAITLDIDNLERLIMDSLLRERLMATLSGFFGLLAALLAIVGLYGVVAYGVARRTQEIGIRMALGADRRRIATMIVRETAGLLAIGLGVGLLLALGAMRLASSMLFGLQPHDPTTFAMAVVLLSAATVAAAAIPARRAALIPPMAALKDE